MARLEIARAIEAVNNRIEAAVVSSGLKQRVRLVAVSKTKPAADVEEAYNAGHRHFGENYVQEIVDKAAELPADIKWHFIGHLQSNKVNALLSVPNLFAIETVDTPKLANRLNTAREKFGGEPLNVFIQVNTSGEDSKAGTTPEGGVDLARHILSSCPNLNLLGLMTIGDPGAGREECFKLLCSCRTQVCAATGLKEENVELSMGMSGDFEEAIKYGSTSVRVGSTIFGARSYPDKS